MVVRGCATGERITVGDICFGCSSGDSERRCWQLALGLPVTLVCSFDVGTSFLRRQLVGVRTKYERGEPVCLTTVPLVLYPNGITQSRAMVTVVRSSVFA